MHVHVHTLQQGNGEHRRRRCLMAFAPSPCIGRRYFSSLQFFSLPTFYSFYFVFGYFGFAWPSGADMVSWSGLLWTSCSKRLCCLLFAPVWYTHRFGLPSYAPNPIHHYGSGDLYTPFCFPHVAKEIMNLSMSEYAAAAFLIWARFLSLAAMIRPSKIVKFGSFLV